MSSSEPGRSSQKGSDNDGSMGIMDAASFVNKVKEQLYVLGKECLRNVPLYDVESGCAIHGWIEVWDKLEDRMIARGLVVIVISQSNVTHDVQVKRVTVIEPTSISQLKYHT
ncbi:hypothetical protein APSETT445_005996 [Aspergillus pseudonomiae]